MSKTAWKRVAAGTYTLELLTTRLKVERSGKHWNVYIDGVWQVNECASKQDACKAALQKVLTNERRALHMAERRIEAAKVVIDEVSALLREGGAE